MRFLCAGVLLLSVAVTIRGADRKVDFSEVKEGQIPSGFRSIVMGTGKPGDWQVMLDEAPSRLPPLSPQAPATDRIAVLAQLARDTTDEHFPMLVFEDELFGDFTLTTRFKPVTGDKERMAGIAFRLQNETNYYVVRASSLGNTFRFYKVVNGQRSTPIGPEATIP